MNTIRLAELTAEAEAPSGYAPVIDAPELRRLLEERADLIHACEAVVGALGTYVNRETSPLRRFVDVVNAVSVLQDAITRASM